MTKEQYDQAEHIMRTMRYVQDYFNELGKFDPSRILVFHDESHQQCEWDVVSLGGDAVKLKIAALKRQFVQDYIDIVSDTIRDAQSRFDKL